jgi:uncharacterized protein (DUF952 family)
VQIFHLALERDWNDAVASGFYTTSTRGRTLQQEGFIHASRADQWESVRSHFYADVSEPLLLLMIDTDRLTSPWREDEVPEAGDSFPHIYGPLNPDAVVSTVLLQAEPGTHAPSAAQATASALGASSFRREMYTEVFFRIVLLLVVIAFAVAGSALVSPQLVGAVIGMAIAAVLDYFALRAFNARREARLGQIS